MLNLRGSRNVPTTDWVGNIPHEAWVEIFDRAIEYPYDFFHYLTVCKSFFAILMNNCNSLLEDVVYDKRTLMSAIWITAMPLTHKMFRVLKREIEEKDYRLDENRFLHHNELNTFKMEIINRTKDLQLLSDIFGIQVNSQIFLPKVLFDHGLVGLAIYLVQSSMCFYYMPPDEHPKLFEVVPPELVIMATNRGVNLECIFFFVPALIADYIIPSYFDKRVLSERDLEAMRAVTKHNSEMFRDYFVNLLWACYILTGETSKDEPTIIAPISKHLEHLGFSWKDLFRWFVMKKELKSCLRLFNMNAVLKVARQWSLDVNQIIEKTKTISVHSADYAKHGVPLDIAIPGSNAVLEVITVLHPKNCKLQQHILTADGLINPNRQNQPKRTPTSEEEDAELLDVLFAGFAAHVKPPLDESELTGPPKKRRRTESSSVDLQPRMVQAPSVEQMQDQSDNTPHYFEMGSLQRTDMYGRPISSDGGNIIHFGTRQLEAPGTETTSMNPVNIPIQNLVSDSQSQPVFVLETTKLPQSPQDAPSADIKKPQPTQAEDIEMKDPSEATYTTEGPWDNYDDMFALEDWMFDKEI